ncbi:hypothetical protein CHH57_16750 [Niallia circulans]|uniref:DUF4879 domain-containing protein n=1 Tax=Niallia circulans TaxID=1397 RepID=A0AA91TQ83_NIACI|nr:DUF4879 domain-containing protein [Niallia circulans]PAD82054.1 hypothetical protein CHH57_16750 [Niallia circulans]
MLGIIAVAVLSFSFVFSVTPTKTLAGPATPLTNLQIIGITSDGNDFLWEDIEFNQLSASIPLKGEYVYLAIYVEGTERQGWLRINSGGTDITAQTIKALPDEPLVGSDNIVYGWIKYYEIPKNLLSSGAINISALNYYDNTTFYDNISFLIE